MASSLLFAKGYTIKHGYAQVAGTPIAATGAATNKLSATAHGLVEGDVVTPSAHATLTVTNYQRYYVKYVDANSFQVATTKGGSAVAIGDSGSATIVPIKQYELDWVNKIGAASEKDNYDWSGSNQKTHLEILSRITLTIDLDCIPIAAHAAIFGKTVLTEATLVGGMVVGSAVGYGGGNDGQGATIGLFFEVAALESAGETVKSYGVWYPRGILTLSQAPGFTSGAVADKQQYNFSAIKGSTDIANGTIAGLSSDGEYYIVAPLV